MHSSQETPDSAQHSSATTGKVTSLYSYLLHQPEVDDAVQQAVVFRRRVAKVHERGALQHEPVFVPLLGQALRVTNRQ